MIFETTAEKIQKHYDKIKETKDIPQDNLED